MELKIEEINEVIIKDYKGKTKLEINPIKFEKVGDKLIIRIGFEDSKNKFGK